MKERYRRVLSIDVNSRGFGFVVLEGTNHLIDWGLRDIRTNRERRTIVKVDDLIGLYSPSLLLVEDIDDPSSRRGARIERVIRAIAALARKHAIRVLPVASAKVRGVLARRGARSKHAIGDVVVALFPELAPYRPPERKMWMSEDQRQAVFDAAAMAAVSFGSSSLEGPFRKQDRMARRARRASECEESPESA